MTTETRCDRCHRIITAEEIALAWPVCSLDHEYICPDCYGDDAYCPAGHVLRGDTDGDDCEQCRAEAGLPALVWAADGAEEEGSR
jgi:hypothetical protein